MIFETKSYNRFSFLPEIDVGTSSPYNLKIFAITGDCPALKSILKFVGHGGYWCCWMCYLKGVHDNGKRQYRYEASIEYRSTRVYSKQSSQAEQEGRSIFGHHGVSPLHSILDNPLPRSIIIDYLHATLLGHGKRMILTIYDQLKPSQRSIIDFQLKNQPCPHFCNRRMRAVSDFAHVKATEIRNTLFYGLLPVLQEHLSIQQLSHLALYVCATRLFHCESLHGDDICAVAEKLFRLYYQDHDDYYTGLQNFVLHLHSHYPIIYRNYGALCHIGCFGQEDLIGYVSSNHNGTRYYGELICHHYNVDFFLQHRTEEQAKDGPIDPSGEVPDQSTYAYGCHRKVCDCDQINRCIVIYRRCMIRERLYHSLIYKKSSKSISYFVEYYLDDTMHQLKYGAIQCFFTCRNEPFALIQRHPMIQLYSDRFKSSKYYPSLKEPLDSLFVILDSKSTRFDCIPVENISRHCIVFDKKNQLIVTTISAYNEHD